MLKKMFLLCGMVLAISSSVFAWAAGSITVDVVNSPMDIKVSAGAKTLLEITGINFGSSSYTSISSSTPATDSLVINLTGGPAVVIKPVFSGIHIYGKVASASTVKITMKNESDHFFGITEQNIFGNSPDLQTKTIEVTATNIQTMANEPNAKAWSAFYMSSLGYGSFFNTFAEGSYMFGVGAVTSITHNTNTIDWYIYYGPTGDKICQAYYKTIQTIEGLGTRSPTKKVPIWACGLVIWHNNYSGSAQILSHITNFTSNQIPITAQWVDRPYSDGLQGWGMMNWSSAFANPATWIKQINSDTGYNVKFMSWAAPCTFGSTYPSGTFASGYYYLDLSDPASFNWYSRKLDSLQHAVGVQGHKMDRCEESMTPVTSGTWADGTPTTEKQAKYLYLNAKVTDQSLRTTWGDNQFNFPRGVYHRCQPYIGAVWAGDTRAPTSGGLTGAIANGIKTAFCGFPVWGSDIGGYGTGAVKIPTEQYLRWLTYGCFSGMMENMLDGKEPYIYTASSDAVLGQTFVSRYKSVCDLRMSLIPYVYSIANTSADKGVGMRPLPYMYPDDSKTYGIGDEHLLGPDLLVAPIYTWGSNSRSVYLPAGKWYNFFDPTDVQTGGATITATAPVYQIPVYIKANSVFPTGQIYAGNSKKWITNFDSTRNIVINAFPGNAGDRDTFAYVDYLDKDSPKLMTLEAVSASGVRVRSPGMTIKGSFKVHLSAAPLTVALNGVAVPSTQYVYTAATLSLQVPFAANPNQQLYLQVNDAVNIRASYDRPVLHGRLQISASPSGVELVLPPITGIAPQARLEVRIVNALGKCVWSGRVANEQSFIAPNRISLGRLGAGSYVAMVKIDGIIAQSNKIAVP